MDGFNWQNLLYAAVATLGIMEYIKGFATHAGKPIDGNLLRVLQLALCMVLAFIIQHLPSFVTQGLLALSLTTLCKTQIIDYLTGKFGGTKTPTETGTAQGTGGTE